MSQKSNADSSDIDQGDLFLCDFGNWPVKDDLGSMEVPLFSLSKNKDTKLRTYTHGNKSITIRPSTDGAATMFDKDLLLYINSQIIAALNQKKPTSKTIQINSTDFLKATFRSDGGNSYAQIMEMLRRLRGTTIETNIATGGIKQTEGFSLIDNYKVVSGKTKKRTKIIEGTNEKVKVEVEEVYEFWVTLSDWIYNGLMSYEALTLNKKYFQLTQPFERRLCEIARKYCGDKAMFKMNIDLVAGKIGGNSERFRVRDLIRKSIKASNIPDYRIALDVSVDPDMVVFYTRDSSKLSKELIKTDKLEWFMTLEKADS